jgi:predicted Zn-dependent protease
MTQTAVDHAYGRALEQEADMYGTRILYGCYYDHDALRAYLARLATSGHGGSLTHASPAARAQVLATYVPRFKFPYDADEQTRDFQAARFRKATGVTAR